MTPPTTEGTTRPPVKYPQRGTRPTTRCTTRRLTNFLDAIREVDAAIEAKKRQALNQFMSDVAFAALAPDIYKKLAAPTDTITE